MGSPSATQSKTMSERWMTYVKSLLIINESISPEAGQSRVNEPDIAKTTVTGLWPDCRGLPCLHKVEADVATGAELTYNINASALAMANTIFGQGVTVVGAS